MNTAICRTSGRSSKLRAFTLVELLVVIGIIALLISILLPSLNRAREAAKAVKCGANLHSIGLALQMYIQDNKGMCPIGYWNGTYNPQDPATSLTGNALTRQTHWGLLLMNSLSGGKLGANAFDVGVLANSGGNRAGAYQMLQCPTVPSDTVNRSNIISVHYTAHPRVFIGLNGNDTGVLYDPAYGATSRTPWRGMRANRVKRSSEIAAIFDGSLTSDAASGTWNPRYNVPLAQGIDNGKFYGYGDGSAGSTALTDNYGLSTYGNTNVSPVSLTPYYGGSAAAINTDSDANPNNIRFRHSGNTTANALMFDGHVEGFRINKGSNTSSLLRGSINTSY